MTYSDLGEGDTALVTLATVASRGSVVLMMVSIIPSMHSSPPSGGYGDISDNQYHPLVDNESDDPDLCQQLRLLLNTSPLTKLQ